MRLVFMLMTGTKANARELYADMIKAVSRLIVTNPGLEKRRTLVDEFNSIDLGRLRRNVKAANFGIPNSHVLQVLITTKFSKPVQSDLLDMIEDAA
ncbi:hypothetical protein [Rhizobium sp. CFBP 8762]|uniref:hypothetical protein n=1 Tax=Rhizobium sp. CFBP 8762 TaxID=2775279 RepID=UPI001FD3A062|nr:hypothetical protein [Rhizobium sp. CFBP 8762]